MPFFSPPSGHKPYFREDHFQGGRPGYQAKDRKITVVEEDAECVRTIFRSYLELGSINLLMGHLRKLRIVTKAQTVKSGRTIGGIAFTSGPLSYLLRNRFYIGEVVYKGEILPGEQKPIIDRNLFDAVQAKLTEQQNNHVQTRAKTDALLMGLIFDDRGNRMSPSHARKEGVRYRYYISLPLAQGQPDLAGTIHRVPAVEIERVVADAVRGEYGAVVGTDPRALITAHVCKVEVQPDQLAIELKALGEPDESDDGAGQKLIYVP